MAGEIHLISEMPRKPRFVPSNYALHITQRGNYRQKVFFTDEDRSQFLALLDHHADLRQVIVHGHVLMSNHFHLGPDGWRRQSILTTSNRAICPITPRPLEPARVPSGKADSIPVSWTITIS